MTENRPLLAGSAWDDGRGRGENMQKPNKRAFQNQLANVIKRSYEDRGKGNSKRKSSARERKQNVFAENTAKQYEIGARDLADFLYEQGVYDLSRAKYRHGKAYVQNLINRMKAGEITKYTLDARVQAVEKLQNAAAVEKGYKITLMKRKEVSEMVKATGEKRRSNPADLRRKKGAIITSEEADRIIETIGKSKSANAKASQAVAKFQRLVGGRVEATMHTKAGDINFEKGTVVIYNDKGGKTREVHVRPDVLDELRPFAQGKNRNAPLFSFYRTDGTLMSVDESKQTYWRTFSKALTQSRG